MKRRFFIALGMVAAVATAGAETKEKVAYGDFEQWITRTIH